MEEQMTPSEQNLRLLSASIPANERFFIWCYDTDGKFIATSCPEPERMLLQKSFQMLGGIEKLLAYAVSGEKRPQLIGSAIGLQWAVTMEVERNGRLLFVMGPVFYSSPTVDGLQSVLRPYRDTVEGAAWAGQMIDRIGVMPIMPYAIFTRYVTMIHNVLTGDQLAVSVLFAGAGYEASLHAARPEDRDRNKIYLAERAMLKMVRNGDINYQSALNLSSTLSPGVPVQGRDPLQQTRISIIVFTSLVCRAAIEGGLSPEVAYPLGDSYIEATLNSNDTGELSALSMTMYHDFIYRVHRLHANPRYSLAVQKCCDYIELSLDRKIRIADLAALTGYTEYYLTEKFKKETGVPLFLYIRYAKIERAKTLLESTEYSVKDISEMLAFNTQNYFIKCFHEVTGYSPAQYRRQFLKPRTR